MLLDIVQIIVAVLLVTTILLQNRGAGLGAAFGGSNISHAKRGSEKTLYISTIILSAVFLIVAFVNVIV